MAGGFTPPALDAHSYSQLMCCPSLTYLLLPGPLLSSLNQAPPILRPLRMPAGVDLTLDGTFNLSLLYQHLAPGGALECLQSERVCACAWGIPVLQASRERQSVWCPSPVLSLLPCPARQMRPSDEVKALLSPASLEVKAATSVCRSQWASRPGQPSLPHPLTLPGWAWESRGHRVQGRVGRAGRAEEPGHGATFERRRLPACRLPRGQASWGRTPCALS